MGRRRALPKLLWEDLFAFIKSAQNETHGDDSLNSSIWACTAEKMSVKFSRFQSPTLFIGSALTLYSYFSVNHELIRTLQKRFPLATRTMAQRYRRVQLCAMMVHWTPECQYVLVVDGQTTRGSWWATRKMCWLGWWVHLPATIDNNNSCLFNARLIMPFVRKSV